MVVTELDTKETSNISSIGTRNVITELFYGFYVLYSDLEKEKRNDSERELE